MDNRTVLERFEEMFIPEPNSGCWLWIGSVPDRYGAFSIDHINHRAHRISWKLYKKTPIGKMKVLHRCDVTVCVNPDHLFLGTSKDNTQDMILKGRKAPIHGELNQMSKLTEDDVGKIRFLVKVGIRQWMIGNFYGISQSAVSNIANGKRWK